MARVGQRGQWVGGVGALLLGIVIGVGVFLHTRPVDTEPPRLDPRVDLGLQLQATDENRLGVGAESHFVLTSRETLSQGVVSAALEVRPAFEFRVEPASATEFHIIPTLPLEPDRVYHFTYRSVATAGLEASWAFQVRSPLRVVLTLPGNETAGVPLDSGIEVTFSHDGVERPEDYIEISPRPDGSFERHKRTVVFVPRTLEPQTIYTVRVRPGLPVAGSDVSLEQEYVFQFETGSSTRAQAVGSAGPRLDFLHRVSEAASGEAPYVSIVTDDGSLRVLPVEVFAYPSLDRFIEDLMAREEIPVWAVNTRASSLVDTTALQPVLMFDASVEGRESFSQFGFFALPSLYFRLPAPLPEGLYLLQARHGSRTVQAWLQITDIATYVAVSQTSTLVWVNDVSDGRPLAGARVEAIGRAALGRTDAEGVTSFATPDYMARTIDRAFGAQQSFGLSFLKVSDDRGRQAIVPISPVLPPSMMSGRCGAFIDFGTGFAGYDFWVFTSTDRPIYQADDTVHFWGVAKSRDGAPEQELTARLFGYPSGRASETVGAKQTLRTTDLGTFSGSLALEGAEPGYYSLNLYSGERYVTGVSFRVDYYTKPAYQVKLQPAKAAYFSGEQVEVDIAVSFFDGTPVPGLELAYRTKNEPPGRITTGADGKARISFTAASESLYDVNSVAATPVGPEQGEIGTEVAVVVFPAALHVQGRAAYSEGAVTVTGDVYRVDPSRYIPDPQYFYTPVSRGAPPAHLVPVGAGQTVAVQVSETYYDVFEVGQRYDFISKNTVPVYRYESRNRSVTTLTATTDARGRVSVTFPGQDRSSYRIVISATDATGRVFTATTFAYAGTSRGFDPGSTVYIAGEDGQFGFVQGTSLALGEEYSVTMRRGTASLPTGGANRYLFYEGQRGIRHHLIQESPTYRGPFSERHVPSATIGGVYFNGFTYLEAQYGPTLTFNPEGRRLTIEVTPGKQTYRPGEEATVNVVVRDANGRPVQAEVNLSAVDEALFTVSDFYGYQTAILTQLYRSLPSGIIRTYASHQYPPQLLQPGGRGGNGGAREDFQDTALYRTLRTDASGRASVSFQLPDNLTSWRVTAFAVTSDLKAGHGRGGVVVSLPFFVDVAVNRDYLPSDRPAIGARAFGSALTGAETVEFVLKAPSLGLDGGGVTVRGQAFGRVDLPLPTLTPGSHEVTVEARSESLEDAVKHTISVVPSRRLTPKVAFYEDVTPGLRLEGSRDGRTTVVFMDGGRGQLYPVLERLRWSYGDRVDQALARVLAAELLAEHFGQPRDVPAFPAALYFVNPTNLRRPPGVALLPYADGDLALTARVAALAPDVFGRTALKNALTRVVNDRAETPERLAIAYSGLAALGEPVLVSVRMLADDPDLGWRGRIHVALALEASGDHPGAAAVLDALYREFGHDLPPYRRLRVGADQNDVLEATALAAVLAAAFGDPRADSLLRYVRDNATSDILLNLEELAYAKKALSRLGAEPVTFAFTVGGVREQVTLEKGATRALSLSASELRELNIEVTSGRLAVATTYNVPLASAGVPTSSDISITRSFRPAGEAGAPILPSDGLVEVVLEFTIGPLAPDGCYQVTDVLPSGLKAVTRPASLSRIVLPPPPGAPARTFTPYYSDGNTISFCVVKGGITRATYYARPVARGEYTWEPATIHNQRAPAVFNLSPPATVRID